MTNKATTWYLLRRLLLTYLPPHKRHLMYALAAMVVVAITMSLSAYYIQPLFDRGLIQQKIGVINTIVLALVGLTIIKGGAYYVQAYYMESIGHRVIADMQQALYHKLLMQDLRFYQLHPTATLTARFISDLQRMKMCIIQIFSSGLRDTAIIIGLMANMIYQNWRLTLFTILILPPTAFIIGRSGRLTRKYARLNQESTGRLSHLLAQTLGYIRQVQSFTAEKREQVRVDRQIDDVYNSSVRASRIRAISSPLIEVIGTVVIGIMMLYAGYQIKHDMLTAGAFASFMASLVIIVRPLKGLANLNHVLQEGLSAAHRTFQVMDMPIHVQEAKNAQTLKVKSGEIKLQNISVTYADGKIALNDVNVTIPAGQTVAFVGASGAGKSTLLNLIPRFFDPSAGKVLIDGQDIRQVTIASLRRHLALVTQDVAIFDETVRANIAYGKPAATPEEVNAGADMAAATDFIENLPNGWDTVLGENGVKLSGGQKQRIAIARALVKDAPILLLDEATSNLDTASERTVQYALEKLAKGRTTLVVAHRLSTIVSADIIHVMDDGKLIESGTHQELLNKKGAYATLWDMQSSGLNT